MRKKVFIGLLLMVFFSITTIANAAITSSEYISNCYAQIATYSGGRVTVSFDIRATDTMDVLGARTIIIQEKAPGSRNWSSVATLSSDDYSNMLAYNRRSHNSDVSYYGGQSGYSYRAKVYFYAEKGGYDTKEFIAD